MLIGAAVSWSLSVGLCCLVLIRGDVLRSVSHSVADEYKIKAVEKVKYISGEEEGVDSQDSRVRDIYCILFFVYNGSLL